MTFPRPHFPFALIVAAVLGLGMGEGEAVTQGQKAVLFSGYSRYTLLLVNSSAPLFLGNGRSPVCLIGGSC